MLIYGGGVFLSFVKWFSNCGCCSCRHTLRAPYTPDQNMPDRLGQSRRHGQTSNTEPDGVCPPVSVGVVGGLVFEHGEDEVAASAGDAYDGGVVVFAFGSFALVVGL